LPSHLRKWQALPARAAAYLIEQADAIFFSNHCDLAEPSIPYKFNPRYTRFKGNPGIA